MFFCQIILTTSNLNVLFIFPPTFLHLQKITDNQVFDTFQHWLLKKKLGFK